MVRRDHAESPNLRRVIVVGSWCEGQRVRLPRAGELATHRISISTFESRVRVLPYFSTGNCPAAIRNVLFDLGSRSRFKVMVHGQGSRSWFMDMVQGYD